MNSFAPAALPGKKQTSNEEENPLSGCLIVSLCWFNHSGKSTHQQKNRLSSLPGEPALSAADRQAGHSGSTRIGPDRGRGGYRRGCLTSLSTRMVTGRAAILLSFRPDLSPGEVRGLMIQGCDPLTDENGDEKFGHGRINVTKSLDLLKEIPKKNRFYPASLPQISQEKWAPKV